MAPVDKNREQSDRTREALVRVARRLFAEKGYGATSTEEIVVAAGVTRGALYHQYKDKRELFADVVEHVERDLAARIGRDVEGLDDPIEMLRRSAEALLDAARESEVRQIALVDAPSVLGWEAWREIDLRYGLGLLQMVLSLAASRGVFDESRVVPISHLFLGAASEAAMVVAHQPGDASVRERMGESLRWMIDRMIA